MHNTIQVRDLAAGYGRGEVITNASFDIVPGAMTGIIGPNGAGKSTLLKALLRQIPFRGQVGGGGAPGLNLREVAYVAQQSGIDTSFPITVEQVVVQGTYAKLRWWQRPSHKDRQWASECLETVGMSEQRVSPIGELSGGQLARVLLARALAQRPSIYLLDEPFAAIDSTSERHIVEVLRRRRDAGDAVVIVHHNLDQVPMYFDRLIAVNRTVVAQGPLDQVLRPDVLARVFPDWAVWEQAGSTSRGQV